MVAEKRKSRNPNPINDQDSRYDIEEKIKYYEKNSESFVIKIEDTSIINVEYFKKNGFKMPLLFKSAKGLG